MTVLEADLIDEKTMKVLGKAFINEIAQLSETSPINGYIYVTIMNLKLQLLESQQLLNRPIGSSIVIVTGHGTTGTI
jgi:hypothetical protein